MRTHALSNDDIGFYTAVATAIPALLIAYTVGLVSLASKLGSDYDRSMRVYLLTIVNFATSRSGALTRALRTVLSGSGSLLALIVVGLAVVLPGVGEYESLHALAAGSASSITKALSVIGIWIASVAVIVPLIIIVLRSFSFIPVVSYWIRVRKNMQDVHSIYSSWERGSVSSTQWMAPAIEFKLFRRTAGPPSGWTGPNNLANLVADAWGNKYPQWHGAVLLGPERVMVFDRVGTEDGATIFRIVEQKVTELFVYQDRERAVSENYGKAALEQGV
jgi:hypothetical protein